MQDWAQITCLEAIRLLSASHFFIHFVLSGITCSTGESLLVGLNAKKKTFYAPERCAFLFESRKTKLV